MRTKNKLTIGIALVFFLAVNSISLWSENLGFWSMFLSILLLMIFVGLTLTLFIHFILGIKERFKNQERTKVTAILSFVITLTFVAPLGLYDFNQLESKDIIVAHREGVAGCSLTLQLKEDKTFIFKGICFGTSTTTGDYISTGDSLFFENVKLGRGMSDFYEFGVKDSLGLIWLYNHRQDSSGIRLKILQIEQKE
jgi:hypothetical protein